MDKQEIRRRNLAKIRDADFGGHQARMADVAGCAPTTLSRILHGKKVEDVIRDWEKNLMYQVGALDRLDFEPIDAFRIRKAPLGMDQDHSASATRTVPHPAAMDQNVSLYAPSTPKRPVIATVIAGNFRDAVPARTSGDEPWEEVPRHSKSSDLAVWLIVDGDSMDDGTPHSFRKDDLILVDPDASWGSGDFVIIANGGDEWTFKRIRKDGPTWYMEALNPGYQPRVREIPTGWRVVAKVLEVMPKGRKVG